MDGRGLSFANWVRNVWRSRVAKCCTVGGWSNVEFNIEGGYDVGARMNYSKSRLCPCCQAPRIGNFDAIRGLTS